MADRVGLNVPGYDEVLVHFPDDDLQYHARLLLVRVRGATWMAASPDLEIQPLDLGQVYHYVCTPNVAYPQYAIDAGLYLFDAFGEGDFDAVLEQAKRAARVLEAPEIALPIADGFVWRYSDPRADGFGDEVPADVLADPVHFVGLAGHGYTHEDGVVYAIESVGPDELDEWKSKRRRVFKDPRLLGEFRTPAGRRHLALLRAIELFDAESPMESTFDGPRCAAEFLTSVATGAGTLTAYDQSWARKSGVNESSAQAHEHTSICEALRLLVEVDQCDAGHLCTAEHLIRRLVVIEMAVKRNPQRPDFSGLGVVTDGVVDETGAARTASFSSWVAKTQYERGQVLKGQRLLSEEKAKAGARATSGADASGGNRGGRGNRGGGGNRGGRGGGGAAADAKKADG